MGQQVWLKNDLRDKVPLIIRNLTGSINTKHVQTYGWQDWVNDGAMSRTAGQSAGSGWRGNRIRLTGELWIIILIFIIVFMLRPMAGWAGQKNGEAAGTEGLYKRLEAIEIQILPKGSKVLQEREALLS